jgi:hypothetical protein
MKLLMFFLMFFIIISLVIINNNDLRISEKEDLHIFLVTYAHWFNVFLSNVRTVTGNIIDQNWLPE